MRIADFIKQLLGHAELADQAARAFDFIDGELAVGADLDDGKTDVRVVRHLAPIGEIAAGALGAAFDDVPGQGGLGEAVVVVPRPVEFMHQRCADHCAVDHATGDDDIRAQCQRLGNARRTEVGIRG